VELAHVLVLCDLGPMRARRAGSILFAAAGVFVLDLACRRPQRKAPADEPLPPPGATQSAVPVRVPKLHRPMAMACTDLPTRRSTDQQCNVDGDCKGREPRCEDHTCTEARCRVDTDCLDGQMCMCGVDYAHTQNARPHSCLPAGCRTDADCGPGGYCSPSPDLQCGHYRGIAGWYCHGPRDACIDDEDCVLASPTGKTPRGYCAYSLVAGRFVCGFGRCVG